MAKTGRHSNQYIKARECGLPDPVISATDRLSRSRRAAAIRWTPEKRQRHSERMKRVVQDNPESYTSNNVSGRVKIIDYNGFRLKGSWELLFAQWLDLISIKWNNQPGPFPYEWNGRTHSYFPDFYLPDHRVYVEVKGFKRPRDVAKWSSFPHPLVVVDGSIIHNLNTFTSVAQLVEQRLYTPSAPD